MLSQECCGARNEQAGLAFVDALDLAVQSLADAPLSWPEYLHGTRRFLVRRFPFLVAYKVKCGRQLLFDDLID